MVAVLLLADDAKRNFRQRIFRDRTNPLDFLYDTKASFGQKQDSSRITFLYLNVQDGRTSPLNNFKRNTTYFNIYICSLKLVNYRKKGL